MHCVIYLTIMSLPVIAYADSQTDLVRRPLSVGSHLTPSAKQSAKEVRREHRERRILRRKKQRMRELREEIRTLTSSLQQIHADAAIKNADITKKQKVRHGRKGVKWRKNLLDKLKIIVRRLDRMEKRIVGSIQDIFTEAPLVNTTELPGVSTTSHNHLLTSEITNEKIKRIQPAISRSRSGENGAVCSAHKDCRPGHCCHRVVSNDSVRSFCVLHRLLEKAECVDGCQCSTQLNCFLPDRLSQRNTTVPYCKKATSSDILDGSYLYKKDSVIIE